MAIRFCAPALLTSALLLSACGSTPRVPPPAAASPAPGSVVIHTVGSGYAAPVYEETANLLRSSRLTLNYQLIAAPDLRGQLRRSGVDAVASESSQPVGNLDHLRGTSEMYVPVGFGGVAVIVNLPGVRRLQLRGGVLADIFRGRIARWNDRRIRRDNPRVQLPSTPITVVHRADAAVSTDLLTHYLAMSSRPWRRGPASGATISWPAGTAVSGDASMRQILAQNPGTIGYTDQATATQDRLSTVRLRNPAGQYVGPSPGALSAVAPPGATDGLSVQTIGSRAPGAYPIAAEAYVISFRDPCAAGLSPDSARGLQRVLGYLVGPGQAVVRRFAFAPLPIAMRRAAGREVRRMLCGGDSL